MKNEFEIRGEITVIFIKNKKGQQFELFIDLSDFEKVKKYSWRATVKANTAYAAATINRSRVEIHRFILDYPNSMVDHKNHNGMDNRRANLRLATRSENHQNLTPGRTIKSSSGLRNVTWHKRCNKWQVALKLNGRNIYMGLYADLQKANEVAIEARKQHFPFAN